MKGKPPLPPDIPTVVSSYYKDDGWEGFGDWLGTGTIAIHLRTYRSFIEARSFVHKLKLKSVSEWIAYCKGQLIVSPPLPSDIPANPRGLYLGKGWNGYPDWLGKYRPLRKK